MYEGKFKTKYRNGPDRRVMLFTFNSISSVYLKIIGDDKSKDGQIQYKGIA